MDEAKERWPLMNANDVLGAVWSPDDGRVSPSDVCAALIKAAKTAGARMFENTGVTGILTEAGRTGALKQTRANQLRCHCLMCGLWSCEVGTMAGATVLAQRVSIYLLTKPIEGIEGNIPTLSDHDSHHIRDDPGGLLVIALSLWASQLSLGSWIKALVLPFKEDWDHFEPMMMNALHVCPPLKRLR